MRRSPWTFGDAEVFAAMFASTFAAVRFLPLLELGWSCPSRALFGIACVTCGMTRAFVGLAHGDVAGALAASPAGAALAAACWSFAVAALVRPIAGFRWPRVPPRAARALVVAALAALLVNWGYLVLRGAAA